MTKHEIGAIRIGPSETLFNIPLAIADRFAEAVSRTANKDGEDDSGVAITPAPEGSTYPPRRDTRPHKGGRRDAGPRHDGPRGDGPRKPRGAGAPGGGTDRYKPKPYGQRNPRKTGKY